MINNNHVLLKMWVGFTKNTSNDTLTMIKMAVMNKTSHDHIEGKIVIKITVVKKFYRTGPFYAHFFSFSIISREKSNQGPML
jgi:hypothetical protein